MIIHIFNIFIASLIATVFIFPISSLDAYFIATFNDYNIYLTILIMVICDIITAIMTYKFTFWLTPKLIKKEKTKEKMKSLQEKVRKWGWGALFIAAATPLPYTLTIYAAGVVGYNNLSAFIFATGLGRLTKYIMVALLTFYGIKFFSFK